jgi:hypothetical protein
VARPPPDLSTAAGHPTSLTLRSASKCIAHACGRGFSNKRKSRRGLLSRLSLRAQPSWRHVSRRVRKRLNVRNRATQAVLVAQRRGYSCLAAGPPGNSSAPLAQPAVRRHS